MELLRTYVTERIDTENYKLTYNFLDNCDITLTQKDGFYSISIALKKGETQTSSIYVTNHLICTQCNGSIEIQFVQQNFNPILNNWDGGNSTRPRMKISLDG